MLNGPQKIVLIRAGKYDYAEVDLSDALQIVGPNNTGKTTLINTLQFLYVDDLRTMDFGSYALDQTLSYYFPDQYSYVLFECLGVTGKCVIGWRGQSRASGGDPERFCFLGPYDAGDFLDEKSQVREPREAGARLALKKFRIIKSAQEHRELLLPPAGADGKGLGIVALRDPDRYRRFRESLKDLLSLSTITQDQMRERLLTLADVRTDVPALDVRRLFGDDYDLIRQRRGGVARFRKHEAEVRSLVQDFAALAAVRGELVCLWADLRAKRDLFEQAHDGRLGEFREEIAAREREIAEVAAQWKDRGTERDACIEERGGIESKLRALEAQAKDFEGFNPDLATAAETNLRHEELRLTKLLSESGTESREKAGQRVELYSGLVRQKEADIANFGRLAVTSLRRHFKEEELAGAFRVLNFELLETPVGDDGISVRDERALLGMVREAAGRVRDGVYEDDNVRIALRNSRRSLEELGDVNVLRERLKEDQETLCRWQAILQAIVQREQLNAELRQRQSELNELRKRIFAHEEFVKARAGEPRLRRELKENAAAIARLDGVLGTLVAKRKEAEEKQGAARNRLRDEENAFSQVMNRFAACIFPEFDAPAAAAVDVPADFDAAIACFLRRQERERDLRRGVDHALTLVAQLVGEQFNGADEAETVGNLAAELEALPDKVEALERDWNALIQGLRGQFAGVLKELDAVRIGVADLNRQFAKVHVSNLKGIRLEVLESGDLVSWLKRLVDLEQPGLFDDDTSLDQTIRNFRQKLEGSPLISYAQLFSLQFTVVGEDGVTHHYQDFRQIESHGTTIAVKVLFNLLVLRRYLREDQCVVPFFLDEIQALDPANREAVLTTSRKLGFLAITAAPEPVTEVDALYFLQPHQGRIVLRQRHRIGIRLSK